MKEGYEKRGNGEKYFLSFPVFIPFSYKLKKMIIRSDDIEHFFSAFFTLVTDHIAFFFPIIHSDRLHESITFTCTISRKIRIHMKRIQTIWTMIPSGTRRMERNFFFTVSTEKCFVSHNKCHRILFVSFYECKYFFGKGKYGFLQKMHFSYMMKTCLKKLKHLP